MLRYKRSWEYLRVSGRRLFGRKLDFWVPAGSEAYAFWNILRMLQRIET